MEAIYQRAKDSDWNSENEVGELLASLIKIMGLNSALEVGVYKGFTALHMIEALPPSAKYTGIDIDDHLDPEIKEAVSLRDAGFIIGDSLKVLPGLGQKYDLIFIDSVHTYDHALAEFKYCEKLINKGGLICFHDSIKFEGVAKVIRYIKGFPHFEVLTLPTPAGNGLSIVKCNY